MIITIVINIDFQLQHVRNKICIVRCIINDQFRLFYQQLALRNNYNFSIYHYY